MSIASEILRIQQAKQAIKDSINNKGGTLTNESIDDYAQAIDNLPSGGGGMTYEDYARTLYLAWGKSNQFATAWGHSLIVEIVNKANYPNGETEGVIIPQGVTSISAGALWNWTSNNQPLVIPDSVTSIGDLAFGNWSSNNQPLVIPDSVTSIGNYAFQDWTSNTHPLVIPDSVTSIGMQAFSSWELVPYVEMKSATPPTLVDSNAFLYQNNAPIYVPDASVTAYKTATNWAFFANNIYPISEKP